MARTSPSASADDATETPVAPSPERASDAILNACSAEDIGCRCGEPLGMTFETQTEHETFFNHTCDECGRHWEYGVRDLGRTFLTTIFCDAISVLRTRVQNMLSLNRVSGGFGAGKSRQMRVATTQYHQ